jgi:rubrerythrin
MITISFPVAPDQIKIEADRLMVEIRARKQELEVLWKLLEMVQKSCTHKGQQTGYNDRDGSWAAACPICGESH